MDKLTSIILVTPKGEQQEFSIRHAENLLAMGDYRNGGWRILEADKYIYTEDGGIRIKPNKGNSSKAKQKADDKEGVTAPEEG